jgi:hypothetical protein
MDEEAPVDESDAAADEPEPDQPKPDDRCPAITLVAGRVVRCMRQVEHLDAHQFVP